MSKSTVKKTKTNEKKRSYTPWYIAGAVLLVMLGSLSFFVSANVYNSERFAAKATKALTAEPTRNAIATEITSEILADQSLIAKRVLTEPTEKIISSMLGTDAFSSIFFGFANNLNRFLTSNDFEPITIDIGSITAPIDSIVDTIKPDNELDLSAYQEKEIVLLENADLPPFKTIGQTLTIIGPLTLLLIAIGAGITFSRARDKRDLLKYSGLVLMISGALLLVLTLTSGSLLTVSIIDPERSVIMQEIYKAFISNFRSMQMMMILFGGVLYGIYYYLVNDIDFSVAKKRN